MTRTAQKKSRIPEFTSRAEEAASWDMHDLTDYWDEFKVVDSKDVTVEKSLSTGITVRLTPDLLRQLRNLAKQRGIGPSTLARMWIIEHLGERNRETPSTPSLG
jgi:hypothetical protein